MSQLPKGWKLDESAPTFPEGWSLEPAVSTDGTVPSKYEAAVAARAAKRKGAYQTSQTDENRAIAGDALREVAAGATFGFSPRIEAAGRAAMGAGSYSENLDTINADREDFKKANPVGAAALGLLGGVAGPAPGALAIARGATNAVRGAGAGQGVANAAGLAAAGGTFGAAQGLGESEDLTDVGGTASSVAKNAAIGATVAPVMGMGLPALWSGIKTVGNIPRDLVGRLSGSEGMAQAWADRRRQTMMEALSRRTGATTGDEAAAHVAARFDDSTLPGESTPVGYVMRNTPMNLQTSDAIRVPDANVSPLTRAADAMTADQHVNARNFVHDVAGTPAHRREAVALRADYNQRATEDMTPDYQRITPQEVTMPELQRLARQDPNVGSVLRESARAAASEGRLPYDQIGNVQRSANAPTQLPLPQTEIDRINALQSASPAAKQRMIAEAQARMPFDDQEPQMTAGVVENALRRAGGRVNPENSAELVTDAAVARNIAAAAGRDAADNPPIADLLTLRAEHRARKQALEDFDRGYNIFDTTGTNRLQQVNEMGEAVARNATPTREGVASRVSSMVGETDTQTMQGVGNLLNNPEAGDILTLAMTRPGAQGRQSANRILDHLQERGQRAAFADSVERIAGGATEAPKEVAEILARAALTYQFTPSAGIARLMQYGATGLSRARADALLRQAAEEATPAVRQQYMDLARQGFERDARRAAMSRILGVYSGAAATQQ